MNEDPEIEISELSQVIKSDGKSLSVEIYRIKGTPDWGLEIVEDGKRDQQLDHFFLAVNIPEKVTLDDGP